jgi:hypothetical protein
MQLFYMVEKLLIKAIWIELNNERQPSPLTSIVKDSTCHPWVVAEHLLWHLGNGAWYFIGTFIRHSKGRKKDT